MLTGSRIELFGGLRLIQNQEVTTRFSTMKAGTLLAYLALSLPAAQPRERLIDLLWPDYDLDSGRNNLSTLLSLLRRQLEPAGTQAGTILVANRITVGLNPETVQTDVGDFDRLCRRAERTEQAEARLALWEEALELVKGELLPEAYDDWALRARERYRQQCHRVRLQRVMLLAELKQVQIGLSEIERMLEQDPLEEQALRLQMNLLAGEGRVEAALEGYQRLVQRLDREQAGQPERETSALAERLRQRLPVERGGTARSIQSPATSAVNVTMVRSEAPLLRQEEARKAAPVVAALPPALTRFFGRDLACQELSAQICAAETRLLTLLGPGGAGKTRLAVETARRLLSHFEGRVRFVSLVDVPNPMLVPHALQNALQISDDSDDPLQAVVVALEGPPILLLLDNLEHLMDADGGWSAKGDLKSGVGIQEVVRVLLERLPNLICLATSRQPLHLEGEQEYPVLPLAMPVAEWGHPSELADCASVSLYVDRARLVKPDFVVSIHNAADVAAICRRLEGMPLAIEMAAAWAKTLPPRRMLERLDRSLDLLVSRRRDLPPRHRSLRAVCEWSYELLTREQQLLFMRLSLFRGGWTLSAAEDVAGEEALTGILELQDGSLIQQEPEVVVEIEGIAPADCPALWEPRYRMLAAVREYGLELLAASDENMVAPRQHARWCLQLANEARSHFHTAQEAAWVRVLTREQDNLWAALTWCRENDPALGLELAAALGPYWKMASALREGSEMLDALLSFPTPPHLQALRARALTGAANLHMLRANYDRASTCFEEALALFEQQDDRRGQANTLHGLANVEFYQQQDDRARDHYERSLAFYEAVGHERGVAVAMNSLGNLELRQKNTRKARQYLEGAISIMRRTNDRFNLAVARGSLAQIDREEGDLARALEGCCEILPIFRDLGVLWAAVLCLRDMADLAQQQGDLPRAVTLLAASDALRSTANFPVPPVARADYDGKLQALRQEAGEPVFKTGWQTGSSLTLDQAVRYALSPAK